MNEEATIDNDVVATDIMEDESVGIVENNNRASAEAGAVRGVARSLQKSVGQRLVKFPAMGRLPAPKMPVPPPSASSSSLPSSLSSISKSTGGRIRLPKNIPKPRAGGGGGGATGSAGRSMPSSVTPKSIPVRQVAKISDRMSTGLDVLDTAQETGVSWRLTRFVSFAVGKFCSVLCLIVAWLLVGSYTTHCSTTDNPLYYLGYNRASVMRKKRTFS